VDRILHFTTFVIACVETNIRNRRPAQVVYVTGGMPVQNGHVQGAGYPPPAQGYAPSTPGQVYVPPGQVHHYNGVKA
jgi:hypothetical protein